METVPLVTIGGAVGANTEGANNKTVISLSKWSGATSVYHCERSCNFLLLSLNDRTSQYVPKWQSVGCWLIEAAVPFNNVVVNDDFISKLILSIDAVEIKPTI